jgi:peptidoglycan hydrolase-like protein with peptidoglycan-binding domain
MRKFTLKAFFIVFLIGSIWFLQPVDIILAGINDDLVSYWKYNEGEDNTCTSSEDICDSQGDNHGERAGAGGANNKPQWSASQKPTLATTNSYALDFDGTDDQITDIGDIDFSGNAFSVSAWVYPDNWGTSGDDYIHNILCDEAAPGDDQNNTTMCFRIGSKGWSSLSQRIALMIHDGSGAHDFESTTNLVADTWTHVTVTWDGSNVKFYINGSLDRTQSDPTLVMNDGTLGFRMGASPVGNRYFDGGLDELRLYDGVLTPTEINELATVNPGVNTLSPVDDATGVGINDNLVITFDKNMQAVGGNNIYIKKLSNDSIVETIAVDNAKITISDSTVTINPATTLDEKTGYYVNVDSGAFEDLSSNDYSGMSGNESWNFTTEDTTDPIVSYFSPDDEAVEVEVDTAFEINFNEAISTSTGNIILYKTSDDSTVETIDITSDLITASSTTALIINPSTTLSSETGYYFIIDATAINDSSGNSYAGITASTTWNFTTADIADPGLLSISPINNATDVAINANLIITLDEAVVTSTGDITIYKTNDNSLVEAFTVTSTLITASSTTGFVINPTLNLDYETEYYITIDATAIDDSSGNSYAGITASTTWSFTTADTPTCATVDNASTYNAYPTCGVSTCNAEYTLTDGLCVANSSGGSSFTPPTPPTVVVPPSFSKNNLNSSVSNVYQMAVSDSEDFSGVSWESYDNSYKTTNKILYVKFRSETGGISKIYVVNPTKITRNITNEINQNCLFDRDLEYGSKGEDVKKLQKYLNNNGSKLADSGAGSPRKETVYFVNRTQSALVKFQTTNNLLATGKLDTATKVFIGCTGEQKKTTFIQQNDIKFSTNIFTRDLKIGMTGEDVKELQKYLNNKGFILLLTGQPGSPGNETTMFGNATQNALIKFQQSIGLPAYGYFGPMTRAILK